MMRKITFLLLGFILGQANSQDCPTGCSCFGYSPEYIVDCSRRDLFSIPVVPPNATELHLQYNNIESVAATSFQGLTQLKYLNLHMNKIENLPAGVFDDLTELRDLRINDNKITSLGSNLFDKLAKVKVLYAHNNALTAVGKDTFAGLVMLQHVSIAGNPNLLSIDADVFSGLVDLKNADISGSMITTISPDLFNRNNNLTYFFMDDITTLVCDDTLIQFVEYMNTDTTFELKGLDTSMCASPVNLRGHAVERLVVVDGKIAVDCPSNCSCFGYTPEFMVDCANRGLSEVPQGIPSYTTELHLQYNQITNTGNFSGLYDLKYLNLHSNKITELPAQVFKDLGNLEALRIHDNLIQSFGSKKFVELTKLKVLYAQNNDLSEITNDTFEGLSKLEHLSVAGNPRLSMIHEDAFFVAPMLKYIDISESSIATFSTSLFNRNKNLLYFFMDDITTLICDDTIHSFVNYKNDESRTVIIEGMDTSACASPMYLEGQWVERLKFHEDKLVSCPVECNCYGYSPEYFIECTNKGLTYIPERIPIDATELHLQFNRITTIKDDSFKGLNKLKYLNLHDNRINNFPGNAWGDLSSLEFLRLNDNEIENLGTYSFVNMGKLKVLYLHNNHLNKLERLTFYALVSLKHISVAGNPYLTTITSTAFQHVPRLEYADISDSPITTLSPDLFQKHENMTYFYVYNIDTLVCDDTILPLLEYLEKNKDNPPVTGANTMTCGSPDYMAGTSVLSLSPDSIVAAGSCPQNCSCFFNIVDCANKGLTEFPTNLPYEAKELHLQGNKLWHIEANKISHMGNLEYLYLHDNEITAVDEDAFVGAAPSLKFITLNNNKLKSLHKDTFKDMRELQVLNLNDNELEGEFSNFGMMTNLVQLSLNNNNLESLSKEDLAALTKLTNFGAGSNPLSSIPDFTKNTNLVFMDLGNTGLTDLPPLPESLMFAQFRDSAIKTITKEALAQAYKLESLDLQGSQVEEIEEGAFIGTPNLFFIGLQENNLVEITDDTFDNLPTMGDLHIENNKNLVSISENAFFSSRKTLQHLDAVNCSIATLSGKTLSIITYSRFYAEFEGNPFKCDCDLQDLATFKASNGGSMDDPVCSTPVSVAGMKIQNVSYADTCSAGPATDPPNVSTKIPESGGNTGLIVGIIILAIIAAGFAGLSFWCYVSNKKLKHSAHSPLHSTTASTHMHSNSAYDDSEAKF